MTYTMHITLAVRFKGNFMSNYYDEILNEIKQLREEGKYQKAKVMIQRELDMPYVPSDIEKQLRKQKRDVLYELSEQSGDTEVSLNKLLNGLKGRAETQLFSASQLSSRNIREFLPEIMDYLAKDPLPEAAGLIINAIAEQEIGEEFVLLKDGVEYTFYGDDITPVSKSEGYLRANKYLYDWVGIKNPAIYDMAKKILIHDVYLFLPLSYSEDESKALALDTIKQISDMMDEPDIYKEACLKAGVYVSESDQS